MEAALRAQHGPDASGFELLDSNEDGLRWRLALIDTAQHSLDIQYYLWYGDVSGKLMVKRLLDAADRGVRVRILVDDLNMLLRDASSVRIGDNIAALIDAHPNVELRLFNPWRKRGLLARGGEMVGDMKRLNQRMHNKVLVVDNRATILGGRNIGDEYLGLNPDFNFHDLDVLGIGPVARQASAVFDAYWNSEWALPASALKQDVDPTAHESGRRRLTEAITNLPALERFPVEPQSWSTQLEALRERMHVGSSKVYSDMPENGQIHHQMAEVMYGLTDSAQREVLMVNAYIIPGERALAGLKALKERDVEIRILTNSLASHDVPAVNSHYKQSRRRILEVSTALYEQRSDAAFQATIADTPPTRAQFVGLHSKAMVVDRERSYIGSMNFDPRSAEINSEMGVIIESRGLGEALANVIERDMLPENSWQVKVDGGGALTWTNDRETVKRQPARSFWQRVQDVVFMAFPKSLY